MMTRLQWSSTVLKICSSYHVFLYRYVLDSEFSEAANISANLQGDTLCIDTVKRITVQPGMSLYHGI